MIFKALEEQIAADYGGSLLESGEVREGEYGYFHKHGRFGTQEVIVTPLESCNPPVHGSHSLLNRDTVEYRRSRSILVPSRSPWRYRQSLDRKACKEEEKSEPTGSLIAGKVNGMSEDVRIVEL